jgi:hypothetical protein
VDNEVTTSQEGDDEMSKYIVSISIAGIASCEVEADSEAAAIDKAMDAIDGLDLVTEWSAYKELIRGNVLWRPGQTQ